MVNLDLRALSAPIIALRPELDEAYQRLDSKWAEITECLQGLAIPTTVSYVFHQDEFDPDFDCLVWRKWNGRRRVCIESHRFCPDGDFETVTTPYDEWSGQQRIDMLAHVPGLFTQAARETQAFIEKTKG